MGSEKVKKDPLFLEGLVGIFRVFLRVQESVVFCNLYDITIPNTLKSGSGKNSFMLTNISSVPFTAIYIRKKESAKQKRDDLTSKY